MRIFKQFIPQDLTINLRNAFDETNARFYSHLCVSKKRPDTMKSEYAWTLRQRDARDGSFQIDDYSTIRSVLISINEKFRSLGYKKEDYPIKDIRFKRYTDRESGLASDGYQFNKSKYSDPVQIMDDGFTSNLKQEINDGKVSKNIIVYLSRINTGRWKQKPSKRTKTWLYSNDCVATVWVKPTTIYVKKNSEDSVRSIQVRKGDLTIADHEELFLGDIVGDFAEAFHVIYKDSPLNPLEKGGYNFVYTQQEVVDSQNKMDGMVWEPTETPFSDMEG
tara:strand:- start:132 stop:962 length:831 start_codon:yes stop_codon:yes gene_type:complete